MMASSNTPGDVNISGNVSGLTSQGGAVGPVTLAYELKQQVYTQEAKDFPVNAGATIGGPGALLTLPAIPAGLQQNLLVIQSNLPVSFQLNGAGTVYTITKNGGYFVLPGGPGAAQIEFGNAGGIDAKVYVLQAVGNP